MGSMDMPPSVALQPKPTLAPAASWPINDAGDTTKQTTSSTTSVAASTKTTRSKQRDPNMAAIIATVVVIVFAVLVTVIVSFCCWKKGSVKAAVSEVSASVRSKKQESFTIDDNKD